MRWTTWWIAVAAFAPGCSKLDVSMTCERGDRHDAFVCRVKTTRNASLDFGRPYRPDKNDDRTVYFDYDDLAGTQTVTVKANDDGKKGSATAKVPAGSWYSLEREGNKITVHVSPGSKVTLDGTEVAVTGGRAEAILDLMRVATLDGKVKLHEIVVVGGDQVRRGQQLSGEYAERAIEQYLRKGHHGSLDGAAPLQPGKNRPMVVLEHMSWRATHPELPLGAVERIADVTIETEVVSKCPATIIDTLGGTSDVVRSRSTWTVVIREASTFKEIARTSFKNTPGRCARSMQEVRDGVGGGPSMQAKVDAWLAAQ